MIGLGLAGRVLHLEALLRNKRAVLVAVSDIDNSRLEAFRNEFGPKVETYVDYGDILKDERVKAVFITSPTPTHVEISLKALKAGKHVLCEKPISNSLEEARMLVEESDRSKDQILMIGHVLRFWPEYVRAKQAVDSGSLGRPILARAYRAVSMPMGYEQFYQKASLSGGVLVDLAIHDLDFMRWMMGDVRSVFAQGGNYTGKGDESLVDYAQVHLNFKDGAMGYANASWCIPNGYPLEASFEVACEKGLVSIYNPQHSFILYEEGAAPLGVTPLEENGYYLEQDAFLRAIQTESIEELPSTPREALKSLELAHAANLSILREEEMTL